MTRNHYIPSFASSVEVFQADAKDGARLSLRYERDIEPPNRGFTSNEISAWEQGVRVGYLRIGFVPRANLTTYLPTVWHHLSSFGGWCESSLFDGFHGPAIHPKTFSPDAFARFRDDLCARQRISNKGWTTYATMMADLEKDRSVQQFIAAFAKFRAYHVDKPLVDYIQTGRNEHQGVFSCNHGRGIGLLLYAAGCHVTHAEGLRLHASGLQSDSAKRLWSFFQAQGWTNTYKRRRRLNPATMPRPDAILAHVYADA